MSDRQPVLFDLGSPDQTPTVFAPPAVRSSPTSVAAAKKIEPHTPTLRDRVFAAIQAAGERGLTDEEGQDASGFSGNTWRPRRSECVEAGRVKDSGKRRPVRSGNDAAVWVAVGLGKG